MVRSDFLKSTLIALKNQKINSEILNLLISTQKCEISVVFATPETLISVIKKSARCSTTVFLCNEFLGVLQECKIAFDEKHYIIDDNGRISGINCFYKGTPVVVLPALFDAVQSSINLIFSKINSEENFEYTAIGSIYVSSDITEYIKPTLAEYSSTKNPLVNIKHFSLYTEISVIAFGNSQAEADFLLNETKNKIKLLLGDDVFSDISSKIEQRTVNLLIENELKIATAESCTGGLMSELITAVPNSSNVFEIGITSYSNRIKQYALLVSKDTLKNYGAVSKQTAAEMAVGVKKLSGADIGVAITGVAGPSASEGKSVGTVYIALCDGIHFWVRQLNLSPLLSREEIRTTACFTAFDLVRRYIECLPKILPEYSTDTENINCLSEQPHYINSSLLFMKNSLNVYLIKEQFKASPLKEHLPVLKKPSSNISPLEKLQKKVIEKHGVKFRFKLPSINLKFKKFNFKNCKFNVTNFEHYLYRLFSIKPTKKLIFNTITIFTSFLLVFSILSVTLFSVCNLAKDNSEKLLIKKIQTYWTDSKVKDISGNYYDFQALNKINKDISAWLTINGTQIDNPVCTYRDSNYYKNKNYMGKSSDYGTLYFAQDNAPGTFKTNTVIYGNNMQNGTMFSDLTNYKDVDFATKFQKISLTTKNYTDEYEIFAVLTLTDNPSYENENDYFDYTCSRFEEESDFEHWITEIKLRSLYNCDLPVESFDRILTLVTDSFEFPSAKTVIFAKAISEDSDDDNYPLTVNPKPKLPLILYQINNLKSPYHNSADFIIKNN